MPPATFVQSAADSAGRAEDAAAGSEASDPALAVAVQSSASITPQEARSDPIGDLVAATVAETPEPDSARESAAAPQPSEPVPDQEPNRPAQAASSSQDVDGAAAGNSAGPPALAFGAEPATSRKHATGGEQTASAPSTPLYRRADGRAAGRRCRVGRFGVSTKRAEGPGDEEKPCRGE
ncbi:MAG: hypothetical protein WB820_03255 [Rhodoplanes sp.]